MAYFNRTNKNTNITSSINTNDKVVINSSKITKYSINNNSINNNNTDSDNVSLDDLFKNYNKENNKADEYISNNIANKYNAPPPNAFQFTELTPVENEVPEQNPSAADIIELVKDPNNHVSFDIEDLGDFQVEAKEINEFTDDVLDFVGKDANKYHLEKENGKWKLKSITNGQGEVLDTTNPNFQQILDTLKNDNVKIDFIAFGPGTNGGPGDVIISTNVGLLDFTFDCETLKLIAGADEDYFSKQSVFSGWNTITEQYGGNQNSLNMNLEEFINDPIVRKKIAEYFPGQEVTDEDLALLFYRMNSVGCGYIATVNTMFEAYKDLSNEEWENIFGFPRVSVDNNGYTINYDYMFLEFFIFYNQQVRKLNTIEDMYGNAEEQRNIDQLGGDAALTGGTFQMTGAEGSNIPDLVTTLSMFLNIKYNLYPEGEYVNGVSKDLGPNDRLSVDTVRSILESGESQIIIGAEHFNLYSPEDLNGNGLLDDKLSADVGAHGMSVTGVTDDGKLIVSSWGNEYILDPNETIGNYGNPIFSIGLIDYPSNLPSSNNQFNQNYENVFLN